MDGLDAFYHTSPKEDQNRCCIRWCARGWPNILLKLARENRLPVTGEVSETEAKMVHDAHDLVEDDLEARNGWVYRFVSRTVIWSANIYGEARGVIGNDPQEAMLKLCDTISTYEQEHSYNQDESGIVYKLSPTFPIWNLKS